MAQKNKKPNQKNWFVQQEERFGANFIEMVRADEMQKGAIRLFRDIARGNINLSTEGQYFTNPQFIENCLIAANSKYVYYSTLFEGLNALSSIDASRVNDANYQATYRNIKLSMEGYGLIYNGLLNIKSSGNLNYLYTLVNQLAPYRFSI